MRTRWLRAALALLGVAVVALSVYASGRLSVSPPWRALGAEVQAAMGPRPGAWRALRGALAYLAIPGLLALAVAMTYAAWRRARQEAYAFVGCLLTANLVVQGVKHGLIPAGSGLNPLSGHAGVAAGACLAWLATDGTPGASRGGASHRGWVRAVAAAAVVVGIGLGVLLAGWHVLPQVLCPIGVASGCAVVTQAASGAPTTLGRRIWPPAAMVGVGLCEAAVVAWLVVERPAVIAAHIQLATASCGAAVMAATVAAIGLVALASRAVSGDIGDVMGAN